ncbi:MAG: helix-turn-helix domain-containing protein [Saprospiraceae bacterium]|nr:helix-turn-helix domain-containing protein [Saprospiraceae bacterium]
MNNNLVVTMSTDELKALIEEGVSNALSKSFQPKKEDDTLLRRKDVSKLFSVSLVTISQWMKNGKLPYHRINSRIFFKKVEVLKAMEISPKYKKASYV